MLMTDTSQLTHRRVRCFSQRANGSRCWQGWVRSLSVAGRSDAASTSASKSSSTAGSSPSPAQPQQPPPGAPAERHVDANGKEEQALDVNAAPLVKVSGNTLERVETGLDQSSLDGAHIRGPTAPSWKSSSTRAWR
jgi:hypothetical protein